MEGLLASPDDLTANQVDNIQRTLSITKLRSLTRPNYVESIITMRKLYFKLLPNEQNRLNSLYSTRSESREEDRETELENSPYYLHPVFSSPGMYES